MDNNVKLKDNCLHVQTYKLKTYWAYFSWIIEFQDFKRVESFHYKVNSIEADDNSRVTYRTLM